MPPRRSLHVFAPRQISAVTVLSRKSQVLVYALNAPGCTVATKSLGARIASLRQALAGDKEKAMT
jgi:hypothetical protein